MELASIAVEYFLEIIHGENKKFSFLAKQWPLLVLFLTSSQAAVPFRVRVSGFSQQFQKEAFLSPFFEAQAHF